jgi:hypothetical protein|tara:strand:- start:133 stop:378 length:246 start_codon:yes stop_codon:yes gene_type:complete
MDIRERIKKIGRTEGLGREALAKRCAMKYTRLRNIVGGQAEVRVSDIAQIALAFPEYEVWLFTGREYPQIGQISPEGKVSQ